MPLLTIMYDSLIDFEGSVVFVDDLEVDLGVDLAYHLSLGPECQYLPGIIGNRSA